MDIIHQVYDHWGYPTIAILFLLLYYMESRWGLRRRVQSRMQRLMTNTAVAVPGFILLRFAFIPAVVWLALQNKAHWHFGLNYLYTPQPALMFGIGFLLLDYSNYIWHVLNHRVGLLWRFHHVHHTDLDLDLTTAVRFHFGELVGSIVFRGAAVVLVGASPLLVLVYEIIFEAATNFHHSNWKLPYRLEKALNKIIVTPRMHGIHHSIVRHETDSNFSVIFSFWDRLHRTLKLNVFQDEITIGVPAYRDAHELTAWELLKLPFQKSRDWKLPDGTVPARGKRPIKKDIQY